MPIKKPQTSSLNFSGSASVSKFCVSTGKAAKTNTAKKLKQENITIFFILQI
jgi:hypothetical protein